MGPSEWGRMRGYGIDLARVCRNGIVRGLLLGASALCGAIIFGVVGVGYLYEQSTGGNGEGAVARHSCSRIVSLAPSLTEVAFAVGLGEAVVAVSGYDSFPPLVTKLPKIGGALDASPERIASYRPTVVLALTEMTDIVSALDKLGIPRIVADHRSVSGILDSLIQVGERCGVERAAIELRRERYNLIEDVKRRNSGQGERVLVTVASAASLTDLAQLHISGTDGFYAELIRFTGAIPVVESPSIPLANVSMEGVVALQPSLIFEVFDRQISIDERLIRLARWGEWPVIPAVAEGRIVTLDTDYAAIPGPRFDRLLLDIEGAMTRDGG